MRANKNLKSLDFNRALSEDIEVYKKEASDVPVLDYKDLKNPLHLKAEIYYKRSRVLRESNTESTKKYLALIIRHNENIIETDIVKYKGEYWEIESIMPLSQERLYDELAIYRYREDIL